VQRLDVADSAAALKAYPAGFTLGQPVKATVLGVDREHHTLDLTMRKAAAAGGHPSPGQLVTGAVVTARGEGVLVQFGGKAQGIVALTDLHDTWVPNALTAVKPGTLVTARVLEPAAGTSSSSSSKGRPQRLQLSLRGSDGGSIEGYTTPAAAAGRQQKGKPAAAAAVEAAPKGLLSKDQLKVGSTVKGYVRAVSAKGLFLQLDRTHMARVKLSQMSDGFVEDPAATFPPGTLVEGKIVAVTPAAPSPGDGAGDTKAGDTGAAKLEVSLRTAPGGGWRQVEDIKEGELTTGKVGQPLVVAGQRGVLGDVIKHSPAAVGRTHELV
jgi:rRNA biogenesis protein RRP5